MTILITGITGSLGTALVEEGIKRNHHIIGVAHSEKRNKLMQLQYPNIELHAADISDGEALDRIISRCNVDDIVHGAAMKYIDICENNPTRAVDVNINGSRNIINSAYRHGVKNVIAVSTDKAINPSCVYGSTKLLMEKIMLENNYSVIQVVNFCFSSGSVLEIWQRAKDKQEPIKVNTNNTVRYFIDAADVASKILDNLSIHGEYLNLDSCYRVHLHDLATAFCEYHDYHNTAEYKAISAEKVEEEVPENVRVMDIDVTELKDMFSRYSYVH